MARPVVLSNGQLFVGLDENGLVHDFYFPYVGLHNLTTARNTGHKIGVWVDGAFGWTDEGDWERDVDFYPDALVSRISLRSAGLGVTLVLNCFVDPDRNAFVRQVDIVNDTADDHEVRLFFHQVFQISRAGRSDSALFMPVGHYLLDYKGKTTLVVGGKHADGTPFDQYCVGNFGIEGKVGAWVDAEDGELSGSAVEHGGVDSVIRFAQKVPAHAVVPVSYWVTASNGMDEAVATHLELMEADVHERLTQVRASWAEWFAPAKDALAALPDDQRLMVQKSLMIVKAHCDTRGSVLASGDSTIYEYGRDYYSYCWPRDAVCSLWPLVRLGIVGEAKAFLAFARDVIQPGGYLLHKYQPDRAIGSTWHPWIQNGKPELGIQEDETAGPIFLALEYLAASGDREFVESFFRAYVVPAANWMTTYVDEPTGLPHASYDLWEQVFLTTTYSTALTVAGLEAAATLADEFEQPADGAKWRKAAEAIKARIDGLLTPEGFFSRGVLLGDDGEVRVNDLVDISSLFGAFMYLRLPADDPRIAATLAAVEEHNLDTSPIGGVIRYPGDDYFLHNHDYPGNPWIVCSLWLAQYYIALGREDEARGLLDWAMARRLPSGVLGEQFDVESAAALGVAPLVWSHAEVINTVLDLAGHARPLSARP